MRSAAEKTAELRNDAKFVTEAHDGGAAEANATATKKTEAAKAERQAAATAGVVEEEEEEQQQPPRWRRGGCGGGTGGGDARNDLERFLVEERGLGGRVGVSYVRFVLAYLKQRHQRASGGARPSRGSRSCSSAAARVASNLSRRRTLVPRTLR